MGVLRLVRLTALAAAAAVLAFAAPPARAVCTDNDLDGFYAGDVPASEKLSGSPQPYHFYDHQILVDQLGRPHVFWRGQGSPGGIFVTRWNGADWTGMDNSPGAENIAGEECPGSCYPGYPTEGCPGYCYRSYPYLAAFDSSNRLVVCWKESVPSPPYYPQYITRWDGSQWTDLQGNPGRQQLPAELDMSIVAMAVDQQARPMFVGVKDVLWPAASNPEIFFSRWDGTAWVTMAGDQGMERVAETAGWSGAPQILLDPAGNPVIIWDDSTTGADVQKNDILIARWSGSAWATMGGAPGYENLTQSSLATSSSPDAAFDARGNLHLAWIEAEISDTASSSTLSYRRWSAASGLWEPEEHPQAAGSGRPGDVRMALGPDGEPSLLWEDTFNGPQVRFSRRAGDTWTGMDGSPGFDALHEKQGIMKQLQLALESDGRPHAAWHTWQGADYDVFHMTWNGTSWTGSTGLPSPDDVSRDNSTSQAARIAIDGDDRPNVIWHEIDTAGGITHSVRYSYWNGTRWGGRLTACGRGGDCNDWDPAVNPDAPELCDDGIDNDCDGWVDRADSQCPSNAAPVAHAGADQSVHVGSVVTLDGSGSSDPDQDYPLAFGWNILSAPSGSAAALSDPSAASPSFTADVPGDFVVELVVADALGLGSVPDQVRVSTWNTAPVADAGPDQAVVAIGTVVSLDGSRSYDEDGDPITHAWSLASRPAGSAALLSDPASPAPTFVADVHGDYVLQLVVSDPWVSSPADTVTVGFDNLPPVAVAGPNQSVIEGTEVALDGSASSDANGDPLSYSWTMVSQPAGSAAAFDDPASSTPHFTADLAGDYLVQLVVHDGFEPSAPSHLTVVAVLRSDALIDLLIEEIDRVNALPPLALVNPNMRNALTNKLQAVIRMVEDGNYDAARDKMVNDVIRKTDGCATVGAPDSNDWLTTCEDQEQVYPLAVRIVELLEELI